MWLKILLFIASIYIKNGFCSYMGTENSLRQDIAEVLEGNFKLSGNNLPFENDELSDTTPINHSEYDFIVIGAGSAGAAIASRLSEIQNWKILLIEDGGKEYSIFDIPALSVALAAGQNNSEFNWNYKGESSNTHCLDQIGQKCDLPRGKIMGGGSTLNAFLATRGNRQDYDDWADELEDDSWSYKSMLKYFKKLENFNGNGVKASKKYRNRGGPVHITASRDHPEIIRAFIEAGKEMGFSEVDYNGPEQIGFGYYQNTMYKGERWSSNRAYLRPVKHRENLILTQHSHVHKILIDEATKTAYGVRYSKNGKIFEVKAKKEVILSAGVFNSPQILMLSGIGPKKHLQDLNINFIEDLPVGEHLIDHVLYNGHLVFTVNDSSTIQIPDVLDPKDQSIKNYIDEKSGPLSEASIVQALSFVNVNNPTDSRPDIRISIFPGSIFVFNGSQSSVKSYKLQPMILNPRSRGKVILRSKNPFDKPKIYTNYLDDPEDIRVFIEGIRFSLKIAQTNAMKKHGSEFQQFPSPCDSHEFESDNYWECELRYHALSVNHPAGTCKMGREDSNTAVVNSKLKVIGIKKLRVADASIIPDNIRGHINIPVIAIGEKAADMIKIDHGSANGY